MSDEPYSFESLDANVVRGVEQAWRREQIAFTRETVSLPVNGDLRLWQRGVRLTPDPARAAQASVLAAQILARRARIKSMPRRASESGLGGGIAGAGFDSFASIDPGDGGCGGD